VYFTYLMAWWRHNWDIARRESFLYNVGCEKCSTLFLTITVTNSCHASAMMMMMMLTLMKWRPWPVSCLALSMMWHGQGLDVRDRVNVSARHGLQALHHYMSWLLTGVDHWRYGLQTVTGQCGDSSMSRCVTIVLSLYSSFDVKSVTTTTIIVRLLRNRDTV